MNELKFAIVLVTPVFAGGVASSLRVLRDALRSCGIYVACFSPTVSSTESMIGFDDHDCASLPKLVQRIPHSFKPILHVTSSVTAHPHISRQILDVNLPVIVTSHGSEALPPPTFAYLALTAVSEAARSAMPWASTQIHIVPNAADPNFFVPTSGTTLPSHKRKPILLWVGRTLDPDWACKDVYGFLHLAASNDEFHYLLIDSCDHSRELGLADWFVGRVEYRHGLGPSELATVYREVSASGGAWLSTSRSEGLPMCLLEAWACGCPVVVPSIGAFSLVRDGVDGVVFNRAEGLEGLRTALKRIGDSGFASRIIQGGLHRTKAEFSAVAVSSQYCEIYQQVLESSTSRSMKGFWREIGNDWTKSMIRGACSALSLIKAKSKATARRIFG